MRAGVIPVLLALLCALAFAPEALARGGRSGGDVHVRGYTRKDGTYVAPHMRSAPDGNFWNNWSTVGNVNPYTGAVGTKTTPPPGYGGPPRRSPQPLTYLPGVLYRADDAVLSDPALRNERGEYPCYFKSGKSGARFYYYGAAGYWTSWMSGNWPRVEGPLELAPWELHDRLFAKLVAISWTKAADLALDEGRPGVALRLVEGHASEFAPEGLADLRKDITTFWQVRIDAIRSQWSAGQQEAALRAATDLASDCSGTSLSQQTAAWAEALRAATPAPPAAKAG